MIVLRWRQSLLACRIAVRKLARLMRVIYINDSKATNPEAACAALQSLAATTAGRIHIIIGGSHKGANFTKLAECIKSYKAVAYFDRRRGGEIR